MSVSIQNQLPTGWDEFLLAARGTYHQSSHNVAYLEPLGFEPWFLTAESQTNGREGQLLAFLTTPLHAASLGTSLEPLAAIGKRIAPVLQAMYGPITSDYQAYAALVMKIAEQARAQGATAFIKPHPLQDRPEAFAAAGFEAKPCATFIIDLSRPRDGLWQGLDSSARRKVKNAQAAGIQTRIVDASQTVAAYFDIVTENRKRNKLAPYAEKSNWGMWHSFQRGGGRLMVAEKEGEVLGGIMISTFGGYVNEWSPSVCQKALEEKWYVGDALHWAVIEWAQQNGCTHYDLTGVAVEPANDKEKGIYGFKQKWGGQLVRSNEYHLSGSAPAHRLVRQIRRIKNRMTRTR